jgi:hypothetical protein
MIVYTGHPIFDYVWICTHSGPYWGRLVGANKGQRGDSWMPLADHEQNITFGSMMSVREQLLQRGLKKVEITAADLDCEGVFHGAVKKPLHEIDFTDAFGSPPPTVVAAKEEKFRAFLFRLVDRYNDRIRSRRYDEADSGIRQDARYLWRLAQ